MTTITALPTPPSRDDPANFRARADAFMAALPTFATEANTVAGEVNANATTATTQAGIATTQAGNASASAAAAAASATAAANAASAAVWVNGNTYGLNACAISQVTFQTYRKKTASSVTIIDPALDNVQWVLLGASPAVSAIDATYSNYGAL